MLPCSLAPRSIDVYYRLEAGLRFVTVSALELVTTSSQFQTRLRFQIGTPCNGGGTNPGSGYARSLYRRRRVVRDGVAASFRWKCNWRYSTISPTNSLLVHNDGLEAHKHSISMLLVNIVVVSSYVDPYKTMSLSPLRISNIKCLHVTHNKQINIVFMLKTLSRSSKPTLIGKNILFVNITQKYPKPTNT